MSYDSRGLPYPETTVKYHGYEVLKDINIKNVTDSFNKLFKLR